MKVRVVVRVRRLCAIDVGELVVRWDRVFVNVK